MCVCMTTIRSTEFVYVSSCKHLQFDSKASCVLTCVLVMRVMFNAMGGDYRGTGTRPPNFAWGTQTQASPQQLLLLVSKN